MKNLARLNINNEKLLSVEDLLNLRGGDAKGIELWCLAYGPTCVLHNMPGTCDWTYNDTVCRTECPNYMGAFYCFSES